MSTLDNQIVHAIRACLGEGNAYLVGGVVRDFLLGRDISGDLDFSTPLEPGEVIKRLRSEHFPAFSTNKKFGTVSTKVAGVDIEITTFRTELYREGNRKPEVTFTTNLEHDLLRRDFTINAIAYDGENFFDPSEGRQDLEKKVLRTPLDPFVTLKDDPLRILRAIRFVSELEFKPTEELKNALYELSEEISGLSKERIGQELTRILKGEFWVEAFILALETGVLDVLFGQEFERRIAERSFNDQVENTELRTPEQRLFAVTSHLSEICTEPNFRQGNIYLLLSNLFETTYLPGIDISGLRRRAKEASDDRRIELLEKDLALLEVNSYQYYVVLEKLTKATLRKYTYELNLNKIRSSATDLIDIQSNNLALRTNDTNEDLLQQAKFYIGESIAYYLLKTVDDFGEVADVQDLTKLLSLLKNSQIFSSLFITFSDLEKYEYAEKAALRYKKLFSLGKIKLSKGEILDFNNNIEKTDARIDQIVHEYKFELKSLRTSQTLDALERKLKISDSIVRNLKRKTQLDQTEIINFELEALRYRALLTSEENDFFEYYETYHVCAENRLAKIELPAKVAKIENGYYQDDAELLMHLFNLQKDTKEKLETMYAVVGNFKLAQKEISFQRYSIQLEWLRLVNGLNTYQSLEEIFQIVTGFRSITYEDRDEAFFVSYLKQLDTVRNFIQNLFFTVRSILFKTSEWSITNEPLQSLLGLVKEGLVSKDEALIMIKRIIRKHYDPNTKIQFVETENSLQNQVSEEVIDMLASGESKMVEFKASLWYSVQEKQLDHKKHIEDHIMMTICGFLNTAGGTLLIGVDDGGDIIGLEQTDFRITRGRTNSLKKDNIRKKLDDVLIKNFGQSQANKINVEFIEISVDKTICKIDVPESSNKPTYYKEECYLRFNASTRKLTVKEALFQFNK